MGRVRYHTQSYYTCWWSMTTYKLRAWVVRRAGARTYTPVITEWRKVAMETALRSGQSRGGGEKTRARGLTPVFISAPRELLDSARMNSRDLSLSCLIRDRAASAPSLAGVGRESLRKTNTRPRDTDPKLRGSRSASNPEPDAASNVTATGKHLRESWIVHSWRAGVGNTRRCRPICLHGTLIPTGRSLSITPEVSGVSVR